MQRSDEIQSMWEEYKRTSRLELRNRLVEAYLPLVNYLADRMAERLPRCVNVDEVRSAGVFGLLGAVEGFDLQRGIKFETYCSVRIRGSILDELRARDWIPRLVRTRGEKFRQQLRQIRSRLGRDPTDQEVLTSLGLSPGEYEGLQRDLEAVKQAHYSLSSRNEYEENDVGRQQAHASALVDHRLADPSAFLHAQEATGYVMDELGEKEREVLQLYYFDGLTMKEVGERMELSESRVCQIHGQAIRHLRGEFAARSDEFEPA